MATHINTKLKHLRKDPVLRRAIKVVTLPDRSGRRDYFEALVTAIVNQQLSGKAAATILKRFVALFSKNGKKFPTPKDVLKMSVPKMRKAGLSRMKISFLKDLSRKILDGTVNFKKMPTMTDEEIIEHLTEVKGIGRWTAEMFLMFSLGREDVFSYGDLALRKGIQKLYKLKQHPTPAQAEKITGKWKPYRTLGSFYLWGILDVE